MWDFFQSTISFIFWVIMIALAGIAISLFTGGNSGDGEDNNYMY